MRITFNGRTLAINGKPGVDQGLPKKPVPWTGTFLVADTAGNAVEAKWLPRQNSPMPYLQAKEMAFRLLEELSAKLEGEHGLAIKKKTFTLIGR
ncbi:hypothetical protein ACIPL1_27675 [Pseudomonas sp. NPDC090202]|uniref:hypothetical protein n=1 Tax=Pseudomonas sp. NPDC090202 TaxID=3364476 RepID=UPI0038249865